MYIIHCKFYNELVFRYYLKNYIAIDLCIKYEKDNWNLNKYLGI